MDHLTCGISSLLHSVVNLILFTLLLVHLILRIDIRCLTLLISVSSQSPPSFSPSVIPSTFHKSFPP